MELRVLRYFLAVAREQSISGAAEYLHLSQPTLSRQLREMEEELGKQLFTRGSRKIALTEEGVILRKRAEEIVNLVQKAENEITQAGETIIGDVYIGTGETDAVRILARAAKQMQKQYPGIRFHISSGDLFDVTEKLDKGLLDFGILFSDIDSTKYDYMEMPIKDTWGVLMRRTDALAGKEYITPEDLLNKPLIMSRQQTANTALVKWFQTDYEKLNIAATYNLIYNASLLVDEGLGYAIGLDKLINVSGDCNLSFKPLYPTLKAKIHVVWKKYPVFSKAAEKYLAKLREIMLNK
ncbi:MAG: LysR family transcriptional regulator [Clostridia bacterium]|nr:LysR family transcriptional regulator [Clostridia bacterium]